MRLQTLFRHTESTLRAGAVLALLGRSAFACASLALTFLHVCSRDVCQVVVVHDVNSQCGRPLTASMSP